MRKTLGILLLSLMPGLAFAVSGPITVINDAVSYSSGFPVNLNAPATGGNKFAASLTYSSATFATNTFTDGQVSTGNITVTSNNILATAATDRLTVPASVLATAAGSKITVSSGVPNSTIFVNGNALVEGVNWNRGASSTTAAIGIAGAINTYIGAMIATNVANVVYATATATGFVGNSYTITSSSIPAYSTAAFTGGAPAPLYGQSITFNGNTSLNGVGWTDSSGISSMTAASIATWLNAFGVIRATNVASVVYTTATASSLLGNSYTLSASTTNLTILSPTFTGGNDNGRVCVNGACVTAGVSFSTGTTAVTASNMANALNALLQGVTVQAVSNVVYATSTAIGTSTGYAMTSSTQPALTLSSPVVTLNGTGTGLLWGGKNPSWLINTSTITILNHGLRPGVPVVFTTGTIAIGGLANATTYFISVVDANNIELASTVSNALAGNGIVLTSSAIPTTAHTYSLIPQVFSAGSVGGVWQVSNDGSNWVNFTTTTGNQPVFNPTYSISGSSTVAQDFGIVDYGWIRYNVTGPTGGAVNLKVLLNGKD